MNDQSVNKLKAINDSIENFTSKSKPIIICVSKTFPLSDLESLIKSGHYHYGENKVQEAEEKWSEKLKTEPNLKIHMVGKLQSNKAKKAVDLFHYIHSLDNQKLSDVLSKAEKEKNKKLNYFIQVNIGNEPQKSGISVKDLPSFFKYCSIENKLNVIGLMVLPPQDKKDNYFLKMQNLNNSLNLKELSMGMSSDYLDALKYGATYIRIGSSIFGSRN